MSKPRCPEGHPLTAGAPDFIGGPVVTMYCETCEEESRRLLAERIERSTKAEAEREAYGFTWEMVDAIRGIVSFFHSRPYMWGDSHNLALAVADRIASLLPPRKETGHGEA